MNKLQKSAYTSFSSPIGIIGISWTLAGINCLQLPEASEQQTIAKLSRYADLSQRAAPPAWIQEVIEKIQKHLTGDLQNFSDAALDLSWLSPFYRSVYGAALRILPGTTKEYGEIAKEILSPNGARAVGQALGRNPILLIIPCHRVLAAGGKPGGFSAYGGLSTKQKLLEIEGRSLVMP